MTEKTERIVARILAVPTFGMAVIVAYQVAVELYLLGEALVIAWVRS